MRTLLSNRDAVDLAQVRRFILGTLSTAQAEAVNEVIYVDGGAGQNSYDGKSPDRAKATIAAALAVATAGDVVAVFPGTYAEHVTMAVANVSLVGLGDVPRQVLLFSAAVDATPMINITAQGCCVANLRCSCGEVTNASMIQVYRVPNCRIEKCEFFLTAIPVLVGVCLSGAITECYHNTVVDCLFDGVTEGILFAANGTMPNGNFIDKCTFVNGVTADITDGGVAVAVTLVWITECKFLGVGGAAPVDYIILDNAGTTGAIARCVFAHATHASAVIVVAGTLLCVSNYTVAGVSIAAPA